jgi:hypothetical protein
LADILIRIRFRLVEDIVQELPVTQQSYVPGVARGVSLNQQPVGCIGIKMEI